MLLFGKKDYFKPRADGTAPVLAFVSKSLTVPVYDVPAVVGRDRGQVDVLLNDATVSRKHLLIGTYENKLTATDQGSTVGTIINGETLEPGIPYYLSEGDKVTIGKLDFVCHLNRERTGKKLTLPTFMQKDTAADTSEMNKADLAEAAEAAEAADKAEAAEVVEAAEAADKAEAAEVVEAAAAAQEEEAAEIVEAAEEAEERQELEDDVVIAGVPDAEPDAEPVIKLMPDPEVEEESADPVSELEDMGLEFNDRTAKFVYYSGQTAVETFEITATPFVIGRAKSDYTPGAAGVSRRHCFIDKTGGTYFITDLESTNGVWINGRRIKPYNRTALEYGDIIGIGDRVYKFEQ